MREFKKGDKINIHDGSYIFGIKNGKYSEYCNYKNGDRDNLTVVETGLSITVPKCFGGVSVNDLLVTDDVGSFWFIQSRFCNPVKPNHTIVIDGHTIIISHGMYLAFRSQFVYNLDGVLGCV